MPRPRRHLEPGGAAKGGPFSFYWRAARAPRYSIIFAFPLLLSYELLALALSQGEVTGVRNGADVLLKSLFVTVGGRYGLVLFGIVILGGGAALAVRDIHRAGGIRLKYFGWMLLESLAYASIFGMVAGTLTVLLLPHLWFVLNGAAVLGIQARQTLPTQLMISLGAGIYEELLFRVLLVSGLAWIALRGFGWTRARANALAVVVGALIFAIFHYIGPYGEPLRLDSFTFRTIAGLLFSGLYVARGFGITAWTHALYDVLLSVG